MKKFLSRGYKAKLRIATKERRIREWQEMAESITAPLKEVVSFSSTPSKKVEEAVCNIVDLQNEIAEEIVNLIAIEREISELLKNSPLEAVDKCILEMRYLNYMKWEDIALAVNYAQRWVLRRHKKALKILRDSATS
ncbi:MAG: hypothetical protein IJZ63_04215 [Clostridia bacterium]|nr:hypothetical protein [Clostridia bacterium]